MNRREVLVTAGGVALAGLAGCSGVTQQSFEANPVILPEDVREELVLAETSRDSSTESLEVEEVDGEVSLTNQFASYARGPARGRPTLIEAFLGEVNGTEGAGPTVVTPASALGLDVVTVGFLEGSPEVPASSIGLTVPGEVAEGDSIDPGSIMARIVTDDIAGNEWVPGSRWRPGSNWFPGSRWIPDVEWIPRNEWIPGSRWVPGTEWLRGTAWEEDDGATEMLVTTGERSFESVFGRSVEDDDGRPFEDGETITTESPLIAAPVGDGAFPEVETALRHSEFELGDLFDSGVPAPLSGATFGQVVLSTPAAKVAGQSVNPLANVGFEEILTSESPVMAFSDIPGAIPAPCGDAGASKCTWIAGPTPIADHPDVPFHSRGGATILDDETDLKSFLGVVSGDDGHWGVGIHMARVEHEGDIVIAAGGNSWPVGSAEYFDTDRGERFSGILGSIIDRGRTLFAATGERFRPIT